jgi:hypothetical protein
MLIVTYAECHLCWLSLMLSVTYAECHLRWVSLMLSVTYAECHLFWVSLMLSVNYATAVNYERKNAYVIDDRIPFQFCQLRIAKSEHKTPGDYIIKLFTAVIYRFS